MNNIPKSRTIEAKHATWNSDTNTWFAKYDADRGNEIDSFNKYNQAKRNQDEFIIKLKKEKERQ